MRKVKRRRGGRNGLWVRFEETEKNIQEKERWEGIRDTKYNVWYRWIKKDNVPEYLRKR